MAKTKSTKYNSKTYYMEESKDDSCFDCCFNISGLCTKPHGMRSCCDEETGKTYIFKKSKRRTASQRFQSNKN